MPSREDLTPSLLTGDTIAGIPVITVTGTPHTMGKSIGQRLSARIRTLIQDRLALLRRLSPILDGSQDRQALRRDQELINERIGTCADRLATAAPPLWMECKGLLEACQLSVEELLIAAAFSDLLGLFETPVPAADSSVIILPRQATDHENSILCMTWMLPPDTVPHLVLLRRIPDHGPSTLTLTIAGLWPVAGISESGLAVASNELRVNNGCSGGIPTQFQIAGMLDAPSFDDACFRAKVSPRLGGRAFHLLHRHGGRQSIEGSGQRSVVLPDPQADIARIHTNHILDQDLQTDEAKPQDPTSRPRLGRLARLARQCCHCDPSQIDEMIGQDLSLHGDKAFFDVDDQWQQRIAAQIILDPAHRCLWIHRGPSPAPLEVAEL